MRVSAGYCNKRASSWNNDSRSALVSPCSDFEPGGGEGGASFNTCNHPLIHPFFSVPQEQDSVTLQFLTNSFTLTKKNVQRKLTYTPVCRGAVVEKQSSRVRPVTEAYVTGKVSRGDLLTRRDSRNRPLTFQPRS